MKTLSLLIFLIGILHCLNGYSQEWKWRDISRNELEERELSETIYREKHFTDSVDFRNTKFAQKVNFYKAEMEFIVDFSDSKFTKESDFEQSTLGKKAMFFNVNFYDSSTFKHAIFDSSDFNQANFHRNVEFYETDFNSSAGFVQTKFHSGVRFEDAIFASSVKFLETEYKSTANYQGAEFKSDADFTRAKFKSTVKFNNVKFKSTADFTQTEFDVKADFSRLECYSRIIFDQCILPKYLDFSGIKELASEIDLTNSRINPKYDTCYLNLTNSAIDKFSFPYTGFKLFFSNNSTYEIKSNVYLLLLAKQKAKGFTQSYETLDKEYQEFQYTDPKGPYENSRIWGHTLNWIDKKWWGYGYDKELIIRNVLIIFLVLSFINSFFLHYLVRQVYANEKIEGLLNRYAAKNPLSRWFAALRYSAFYTAIIFFSFKFDMEKLNYSGNLDGWKVLNLTYFMVIYLGGLVCLAYLANYIITV